MGNKIEIKKEDLKKVLLTLLDKIELLEDTSFVLDQDFYWNIPEEGLYNVYDEPKEMTMGSIEEDWEFLQNIINGKREAIGYDFNKISSILKWIGYSQKF